ncbi:family 10 glycosylhydrolase [Niabella beijingensis]|uniref:family 10 glycosylhydrolase n=1 Tax=Niabella beijingensis TaxID=2872700 RepID=UPI001CC02FF7|nr:family 10 glycosylhydrolase [Niabella beijingensis]MBZ4189612.1 family 10 glycosylhydrolase [Niabella beijingensis]
MRFLFFTAYSFALVGLYSCTSHRPVAGTVRPTVTADLPFPVAEREFRAAWVPTVANISWPSKPGLPVAEQQKEAITLLDFLKVHHFNAVIFQVRPQADALYKSALEPWSYYLTGTQGKAPEPFYDPLQFWIDAAHARGLELHVWLNPYRAHHISGGPVTESSLVKTKPELVVKLKEGYWWFDPSLKATQDHGISVVMDIVKRYDIDGVHFDDYFYPYPSYNGNQDFPDSLSWVQYQKSGGRLSRGDWRRNSVNTFIQRLYAEIKKEKKYVKFGISPFGIWRPGHPASVTGFDQYDELYADARLWLNKGWVDYLSPQLYWPTSRLGQSYPVLLGWWAGENTMSRHLWPGISVGRDTSKANTTEVINQIMIDRGMQPAGSGVVHWSISSLIKNPGLANALTEGPYKKQALVPASSWLDAAAPAAPRITLTQQADTAVVQWSHTDAKDVYHWVVYYRYGNSWNYKILDPATRSLELNMQVDGHLLQRVAVSAVDRSGNESAATEAVWNKVTILSRSSWQAAPARPYKRHTPVRITVHHEGGKVLSDTSSAARRLKNIQTWCMGPDRKWTDIPYHYLIAPDGTVYEGRDPLTVGETNTEYDPTGHLLICFLGNYEQQELTPHLLDVLSRLIAQCCKQYNIAPETLSTHRNHSKMTTCPGKNIYPFFENGYVKNRVKELLKQ